MSIHQIDATFFWTGPIPTDCPGLQITCGIEEYYAPFPQYPSKDHITPLHLADSLGGKTVIQLDLGSAYAMTVQSETMEPTFCEKWLTPYKTHAFFLSCQKNQLCLQTVSRAYDISRSPFASKLIEVAASVKNANHWIKGAYYSKVVSQLLQAKQPEQAFNYLCHRVRPSLANAVEKCKLKHLDYNLFDVGVFYVENRLDLDNARLVLQEIKNWSLQKRLLNSKIKQFQVFIDEIEKIEKNMLIERFHPSMVYYALKHQKYRAFKRLLFRITDDRDRKHYLNEWEKIRLQRVPSYKTLRMLSNNFETKFEVIPLMSQYCKAADLEKIAASAREDYDPIGKQLYDIVQHALPYVKKTESVIDHMLEGKERALEDFQMS